MNASLIETTEYLSINYLNGKNYDYHDIKAHDEIKRKISVTNVNKNDTYVTISLMNVEKDSDKLRLKVIDNNSGEEVYNEYITNVDIEVIKTKELASGSTLSYTYTIINDSDEDVKYFSANLLAYTEVFKKEVKPFSELLLASNPIKSAYTVPGKEIANTNEGLIKSEDDLGTAYYYRGSVDNNYVSVGGFLFRILRINGDESIRLILNEPIGETLAYNNDTSETDDYKNKLIFDNASIKTKLDSWYKENLQDYEKYIVNSSFCNDTNVSSEENNISYLSPYSRIFVDESPSLVCSGTVSKSNIGLITVDEAVMAGAYKDKANKNYFLYNPNNGSGLWTMSGSKIMNKNNAVLGIIINSNGSLNFDKKINLEYYIRPVISIDKNTIVTGTGSKDDPYVINK